MHAKYEDRTYASNLPAAAIESKNMSFYAHWHEDVELICVLQGSLLVGVNNESRVLQGGDIAVCSSGDIHFYDCRGQESVHRMIIFRPELIDSAGGWPRALVFNSPFLPAESSGALYNEFNSAFRTVLQETLSSDQVSTMMVKSCLLRLCALFERAVPAQPLAQGKGVHKNHRLKEMQDVLSFIESNYSENIRLEDAAAVANLSVCHFSRLFSSIAGAGFKSYLTQLRVSKAEDLLKSSKCSITDIAYQCGFGSIRSFNRVFIALRGVPPSRFRI